MKAINLSDSRGRNTRVGLESRRSRTSTRFVDGNGQPVRSVRLVKGSLRTDLKALTEQCSLEDFAVHRSLSKAMMSAPDPSI